MAKANFDSLPCEIKYQIFNYIPGSHILRAITSTRLLNKLNAFDLTPLLAPHLPPFKLIFNSFGLSHLRWLANSSLAPYVREMQLADVYLFNEVLLFRDEEANTIKGRKFCPGPRNVAYLDRSADAWQRRRIGRLVNGMMRRRFVTPGSTRLEKRIQRADAFWGVWKTRSAGREEIESSMLQEGVEGRANMEEFARLLSKFERVRTIGECTVVKCIARWREDNSEIESRMPAVYVPGPERDATGQEYRCLAPLPKQYSALSMLAHLCRVTQAGGSSFGRSIQHLSLVRSDLAHRRDSPTPGPWDVTGNGFWSRPYDGRKDPTHEEYFTDCHDPPMPSSDDATVVVATFPNISSLELMSRRDSYWKWQNRLSNWQQRPTVFVPSILPSMHLLKLRRLKINGTIEPQAMLALLQSQIMSLEELYIHDSQTYNFYPHDTPAIDAIIAQLQLFQMYQNRLNVLYVAYDCFEEWDSDYDLYGNSWIDDKPVFIGKVSEEIMARSYLVDMALTYYRAFGEDPKVRTGDLRRLCINTRIEGLEKEIEKRKKAARAARRQIVGDYGWWLCACFGKCALLQEGAKCFKWCRDCNKGLERSIWLGDEPIDRRW